MSKRTVIACLAAVVCAAGIIHATPAQDRVNAFRVKCELQTAGAQSLQTLTWQQGTTPLLSLDQYRDGRAVDADSNAVAIVRFGPRATGSGYFVSVTNYATAGNGYLVQMPTIGTNTTAVAGGTNWWWTAYYEKNGYRYWTGNGRLQIIATDSTADGLHWQTVTCATETDPVWTADKDEYTKTSDLGGIIATSVVNRAGTVTGSQSNSIVTAAAHAAMAHGVTVYDGFAGGNGATAGDGGAIGSLAYAGSGGAAGVACSANNGGAMGYTVTTVDGGAIGWNAISVDGGSVGHGALTSDGFAGGKNAQTIAEGTGIDAIQLGTGGNSTPRTLQVYGFRMMNADGTIPAARISMPGPGCTVNGTGATLVITGAPPSVAWNATPSGALAVSVAANAPRYWYSIVSTKAATAWPAGAQISTNSSGTQPFIYAIGPATGTLWRVVGGGR